MAESDEDLARRQAMKAKLNRLYDDGDLEENTDLFSDPPEEKSQVARVKANHMKYLHDVIDGLNEMRTKLQNPADNYDKSLKTKLDHVVDSFTKRNYGQDDLLNELKDLEKWNNAQPKHMFVKLVAKILEHAIKVAMHGFTGPKAQKSKDAMSLAIKNFSDERLKQQSTKAKIGFHTSKLENKNHNESNRGR